MKQIIIKRHTKSYVISDLTLHLDGELFIPKADVEITHERIDGRQRRFLSDDYIFLLESSGPSIDIKFNALITRSDFNAMSNNHSQLLTLENEEFLAEAFLSLIRVNGEYNDKFFVEIVASITGSVTPKALNQ